MWVIFALLDPDPDSDSGSGSNDPIESGSNWVPDSQPWLYLLFNWNIFLVVFVLIHLAEEEVDGIAAMGLGGLLEVFGDKIHPIPPLCLRHLQHNVLKSPWIIRPYIPELSVTEQIFLAIVSL